MGTRPQQIERAAAPHFALDGSDPFAGLTLDTLARLHSDHLKRIGSKDPARWNYVDRLREAAVQFRAFYNAQQDPVGH